VVAAAGQSVPQDDPVSFTFASADFQAVVKVDRLVDVTFGDRVLWADQRGVGALLATLTYLSVTVRAEQLHF
jgi:hypothetical protein